MNTTNYQDDPRLTAYALGELSQGEREQVEALLRDNDSARQIVEEIRATAELLRSELASAATDATQRDAVTANANHPRRSPRARFLTYVASGLAAAAVIALGFAAFVPSLNRAREVATIQREREAEPFPSVETAKSQRSATQPQAQIPALKKDSQKLAESLKYVQQQGQPATPQWVDNPGSIAGVPPMEQNQQSVIGELGALPNVSLSVRGTQASPAPTRSADYSPENQATSGFRLNNSIQPAFSKDHEALDDGATLRDRYGAHNTESYDRITDNAFLDVAHNPLSTFSIDVDTASYSNIRRFINEQSQLPPRDAVRIE
ncbi:hypothetical protein BH09PLA1_BH09PLA1_36140 [soil metagenome]